MALFKYIIWRRDDGMIGMSPYHLPRAWVQKSDGHWVTFEEIDSCESMEEAHRKVVALTPCYVSP